MWIQWSSTYVCNKIVNLVQSQLLCNIFREKGFETNDSIMYAQQDSMKLIEIL